MERYGHKLGWGDDVLSRQKTKFKTAIIIIFTELKEAMLDE